MPFALRIKRSAAAHSTTWDLPTQVADLFKFQGYTAPPLSPMSSMQKVTMLAYSKGSCVMSLPNLETDDISEGRRIELQICLGQKIQIN